MPLRSRVVRNFFKGLSVTQLSAGALAAVTSFLLSAKIGIAGSVIGVAVGSIVSAVASQIYQNVLKASSEKLQNAVPFHATDGADGADGLEGETAVSADDATTRLDAIAESAAEPVAATQTMPVTGRVVRGSASVSRRDGVSSGAAEVGRNRSGVNRQRGTAASAKAKRVAILVAIGSALVAVAVTAGIILAVTQGQGTDSVVRDWVDRSYTERPIGPVDGGDRDREPEDGAAGTDDGTTGSDPSTNTPDTTDGNTGGASGSNDSGASGTTTPQPDGESSTDGTTDSGTEDGSVDGSTGVDGSSSQGGGTLQGSTDTGTQGTTGSDTSSGSSGSSTSGTDTAGK
ncbi:hypothetical protein BIGA_0221 [Bifidobacterium pullorum subsp. gallinarum]|uniref:Uncharacterized protein n=1 Tax=Bifidobacterium pullorum subsp. gallinarum TaxID=78344 RepID=A0A087ASF0_9BIFI|nr:hypothetical protein BIGA_0221 [Bifidobacterium pullorum subsp. gallinarum]